MKLPIIHNQIRQKSLDLVVQEIRGGAKLHLVFLNGTTDQEVENRNTPTGFGRLLQKAEVAFDITDGVKYAVNNSSVTPHSDITSITLGGNTYYTLNGNGALSVSSIVKTHNDSGIYWLNLLADAEVTFTSQTPYDAIAVVMNYNNTDKTGTILMAARTLEPVTQATDDEKAFPIVITF